MKTLILLTLGAVLVGGDPVVADEIYVPNNKLQGGGNVIPFGGQWPSRTNPNGEFTYQWWIPAASMGGKTGLITGIALLPRRAGVHTATQAEILMSHNKLAVATTVFAQNLPQPAKIFPTGAWTWTAVKDTWSPFTLPAGASFAYNGTDNLTIQIRLNGSKVTGSSTGWIDCWDESVSNSSTRIYKYGTGAYTAASGSRTTGLGLKLRLTFVPVSITGTGTPKPGNTITLALRAPGDAALPYQVGSSLGTGPVPIGTRVLNLSLDDMLKVSVQGLLPTIFRRYTGFLSATGQGVADIVIPNAGVLVGVRIHSAFLTIKAGEPFNVKSISNTWSFTITR